jgi:hypothetical protein
MLIEGRNVSYLVAKSDNSALQANLLGVLANVVEKEITRLWECEDVILHYVNNQNMVISDSLRVSITLSPGMELNFFISEILQVPLDVTLSIAEKTTAIDGNQLILVYGDQIQNDVLSRKKLSENFFYKAQIFLFVSSCIQQYFSAVLMSVNDRFQFKQWADNPKEVVDFFVRYYLDGFADKSQKNAMLSLEVDSFTFVGAVLSLLENYNINGIGNSLFQIFLLKCDYSNNLATSSSSSSTSSSSSSSTLELRVRSCANTTFKRRLINSNTPG